MSKVKIYSFFTALFIGFAVLAGPVLAAGELIVRVDQPSTPTNRRAFDLSFTAMDILSRGITAQCSMKAPGDSGFSAVGSTVTLSATGGSGICSIPENRVNNAGSYQYQVKATAGSETTTVSVTVEYVNFNPSTPSDYRKEEITNCDYRIYFRTGDGTDRVELYRSDSTSFNADSGTKVSGINIGSNQNGEITNSVPDCNKTYYYALRAYNAAGNGSDLVGDREIHTVVVYPTTTTTSGAIPVSGTGVSGALSPQVLGEGTETLTGEGADGVVVSPVPSGEPMDETASGEASGAGSVFDSPITWIAVLGLAGLIYWFSRRRPPQT